MRRILVFAGVMLAAVVMIAPTAGAATSAAVNGGGRGTVDGATPFSQFGFEVTRHADGSVTGHFNCLMAGASEFPGFDLMAVRGEVTNAVFTPDAVTFNGEGMFQTGNQGKSSATFRVAVTEGGPGVGTLQLTLLTPMVSVMPTEHVLNGRIDMR
jgi:hypothetical protein